MAELTEADRYLLEQIRKGEPDGWVQLVGRYQGRLLAFARSRLQKKSEAEDLVQETFITFLQNLAKFRDAYSLETYLFTILRRKVIDFFRGRGTRTCFLSDVLQGGQADSSRAPAEVTSPEMSASWYVRRDETSEKGRDALRTAITEL